MTVYGDHDHMLQMLRTNSSQEVDAEVTERLERIAGIVSGLIDEKLKRSFGSGQDSTSRVFWGTYSPVLLFETAARTVTQVKVGGELVDNVFTGGEVFDPSNYYPWPYDGRLSLIYGLHLRTIQRDWNWHSVFSPMYPRTPVQVTGTWEDGDTDDSVPDDINYIADIITVQLFKNESTNASGSILTGEDSSDSPKDPWKFSVVRDVMDKYRYPTPVIM